MRHVVMNWAYNDKEYYQSNQQFLDSLIRERYFNLACKWLAYGDQKAAQECFHNYKKFGGLISRKFKFFSLLSHIPAVISRSLLRFTHTSLLKVARNII